MTREETVKNLLTELIDMIDNGSQRDLDRADEIAKTIIKALSQEPCDDTISRQAVLSMQYRIDDSATLSTRDVVNVDDIEDLQPIRPQLCDDAISRMLAQEEITKSIELKENPHQLWERIQALPSVTQKSAKDYLDMADRKAKKIKDALSVTQKSGKWIDREEYDADRWKCSICGRTEQYQERYCPSCGAKMESEE